MLRFSVTLLVLLLAGALASAQTTPPPPAPEYRARWAALFAEATGAEDLSPGAEWQALEEAAARIRVIRGEAARVEAERHAIDPHDIVIDPYALTIADPSALEWMDEASLAATRRVYDAYLRESLFAPIERGADAGVRVPLVAQPLRNLRVDWLGSVREPARWETTRAWEQLERGRALDAARTFDGVLELGVAATRVPTIIGRLTGLSILNMGAGTLIRAIAQGKIDGAAAEAFAEVLERRRGRIPALAFTVEGDRLWTLDALDRVFTEGARPGAEAEAWMALLAAGAARETNVLAIDEYFDALSRWTAAPPRERREAAQTPRELVLEMSDEEGLARMLLRPSSDRFVDNEASASAMLDGLRLMLALESYRAEHGAYPAALDALVPDFIAALPHDGYAPDGRWRYRLIERGGVGGDGGGEVAGGAEGVAMPYVLYSVGYDGQDDGGIPSDPPAAACYWRAAGTDFVVNATGE